MTDTLTPEAEVVRICRELIQIDSSNYGDGSGPGERACAEYVMGELAEVGLDPLYVESAPGRATVLVRIEGSDRSRPGLAIHGHLDVVPANAVDWQVDPFGAEVKDGCIWGRGAVDMKDMDAMMLANLRHLARSGMKPPRDLVFGFFADEESGGLLGSHWVVDNHPELFEGVSEAISEVGGYSVTVPARADRRTYPRISPADGGEGARVATADRPRTGGARVSAQRPERDRASRGSDRADRLARVAPRIHRLGAAAARRTQRDHRYPYDDGSHEELLAHLGGARGFVLGTLQDTATLTMLESGYKHNVVPQTASASLDCRSCRVTRTS
jgi:acetylornithine deacetylase/succinyl-diaminopimelate desuccinylase-like protein